MTEFLDHPLIQMLLFLLIMWVMKKVFVDD